MATMDSLGKLGGEGEGLIGMLGSRGGGFVGLVGEIGVGFGFEGAGEDGAGEKQYTWVGALSEGGGWEGMKLFGRNCQWTTAL